MIHSRDVSPTGRLIPLCGSTDRLPTIVPPTITELRALIDCYECLEMLEGKPNRHNKRFTKGNQRVIIKK